MHLRSDTLSSSRGRRTALHAPLLVLLRLPAAVLLLAAPATASAIGGIPSITPLSVAAPLAASPSTVESVTPKQGPAAGGTAVVIKGKGFLPASTVAFGGVAATEVKVVNPEEITAKTPAGSGEVEVVVSGEGGSSSGGPKYTYIEALRPAPPSIEPKPPSPAPETPPPSSPNLPPTGGGSVPTPTGPPPPVLAHSLDLAPVTGQVSVRFPGARKFVSLKTAQRVPVRTVVETTHGEVSVTARAAHGGTETAQFFDGEFMLTQGRNGRVAATLSGGDFSGCPRVPRAAGARLVRRLWAEASGAFATTGRYATGIVSGAQWLTEDLCGRTLILPTRGRVEVTDLVRHRHVKALPGDVYTAKAR
jgi:hypothetical protein